MTKMPEELAVHMDDPLWRLSNLYKIVIKGDDDDDALVMQFKPNKAQRRLLARRSPAATARAVQDGEWGNQAGAGVGVDLHRLKMG